VQSKVQRNEKRTFASLQDLVQHRHEKGRYAIAYFETANSLAVEFTAMAKTATEYLATLSKEDYFLVDDLARRGLETQTPFVWIEAINLPGARLQRRMLTSQAHIDVDLIAQVVPDDSFTGLRAALHYVGSMAAFSKEVHTEFDVLGVIMRSRIAGICHVLSLETQPVSLTEREQVVLKWSAMGKTSEDIAGILGLDKRHIDYAFTTAANKLGTNNRIHTVIAAFKDNLIA
jgi:LuxR family quorum sensing-dependent transcriptional regulator